jgi:hypothetical protein
MAQRYRGNPLIPSIPNPRPPLPPVAAVGGVSDERAVPACAAVATERCALSTFAAGAGYA